MKRAVLIIIVLLLIGALIALIFASNINLSNIINTDNRPNEATTPTPTPTEEEEADDLPEGWTRAYDEALSYRFAYPSDWVFTPAAAQSGESAIYSFDPFEEPGQGGIPAQELKIGVTFFPEGGNREINFEDANITSEESITVDGRQATRRVIEGAGRGSIATTVEMDNGTYLISAYPPDSQRIDIYDEFLNRIRLGVQPPIEVNDISPGDSINFPLTITGQAPGNWFFEGQLPITIVTNNGGTITQTTATTDEDWMTTDMINFSASITSIQTDEDQAFMVIEKANPSDLPRNAFSYYLPIEL